jgi:hypothetical protein
LGKIIIFAIVLILFVLTGFILYCLCLASGRAAHQLEENELWEEIENSRRN